MSDRDEQLKQALSDLTNALQTAAPLATQQRRVLGDLAQDALTLEAAVDRAVRVVRRLAPGDSEGGGGGLR
jgi:ABC-type transporter Mla subunit MlaD